MVANRVAGHLFYQADSASFLDADVGAPVFEQPERPPVLGAYLNRLANARVFGWSAFGHFAGTTGWVSIPLFVALL